jgi:hypothetical protein
MNLSPILCRAQEAHHRSRAASTLLANVRIIAEDAATAWSKEAVAAEQRGRRQERIDAFVAKGQKQRKLSREQHDKLLSENPDRGFTDV